MPYKNAASERASLWVQANRERQRVNHKRARDRQRALVLAAYGGVCACCGEDEYAFLALDHIDGGGRADRSARGGADWWASLIREGFPEGYQVLCHNCNSAKSWSGACPHAGGLRRVIGDMVGEKLKYDTVRRLAPHCARGHDLTAENVYFYRGVRHCRVCQKIRQRERQVERTRRQSARRREQRRVAALPSTPT